MATKIMLTKADQKKLEDLAGDIDSLESELSRAARAGIDISEIQTDFDRMKNLRIGLIREYGPDKG